MEIQQELIDKITSGQCVIFLGAGSSIDAQAPSASQLARELNEQFLHGKYENESLNKISSYIETKPGLGKTEIIRYLTDKLTKLEPSNGHLLIPKFNWASIYTTNYDTLIEQAYSKSGIDYRPIINNADFMNYNENENPQLIYKPHGCISRPDSIILTEDDYYKCTESRATIFRQLEIHKYRSTFLFIGYSFSDFNLSKIWFDVKKEAGEFSHWSYAVWPNCTEEQKYLWHSRKVALIDARFSDFMIELSKKIDIKKAEQVIDNNNEGMRELNSSSEVVKALLTCMESKDVVNKSHSILTSVISVELSKELQLNTNTQKDIEIAALIHDVGKMKIPESILFKSGALNISEFDMLKQHAIFGEQIISSLSSIQHLSKIIRHHHEKFNGEGYPDSIKYDEIPIEARIISLADNFSALCTNRSYRSALSIEDAVEYIMTSSGTNYDPQVVNAFKTLYKNGLISKIIYKYNGSDY